MILGREPERAEIDSLLSVVRAGRGRLLAIAGEPGIGKTTLLAAAHQAAADLTVLQAAGRESEADLPFVAIADLFRPLQDRIPELPESQAKALDSALALAEPSPADRGAVNAAALTLLGLSVREAPLLVLIDDYHWLDSASRDVIDFIARRTEPAGFGMILTTRGRLPADHRGSHLQLQPLPPEVAVAVVEGRGQASPEAVRRIVALAAGNPLALVELPLQLGSPDHAPPFAEPVSISGAVERAYRTRLEGLPPTALAALLALAVEGTGSRAAVGRVLEALDLRLESLDPALAAGLIVLEGPVVRFRHPLLRSVVHQLAPPGEVRRGHLAAANTVDDQDQRAWHQAAAVTGPDDDVARALEGAAQRALGRGAAATAATTLQRAAELSSQAADRYHRFAAAARAAHRAGNMAFTARLLEGARLCNGGTRPDPGLLLLDADIRMRRGDFAGAYGTLRLEAAGIADRDPHRAATMLLLASKLRVYRFEAGEAMKEVEEALSLIPDSERDIVHLASLSMTRTMAGHPQARAAVLEAMAAALETAHGHTHTLGIGWPLLWLEEYEKARAFITRSVEMQREGGHLAYLPQALLAMAELDFRTGHWDPARAHTTEAQLLFEEGQQPTEAAIAFALLAKLEAASGQEEAARAHAATATGSDVGSGLRASTAYAAAALGLLSLGLGQHDEAIEHLRHARQILITGDIREPWLVPLDADLAEAHLRAGDRSAATEIATDLVERGRSMGRQSAVASGLRCLGLATDDDFVPFFEEAISLHEHFPTPFELARTELCYGERLRRNRHRVEARSHLNRALTTFQHLGAEPWARRAESELSASGQTLQRRSPVTELTPQERQVANLVGSGATNREAATVLFVSPKTIEFHLGNVYRKLGVRSRTQLANALSNLSRPKLPG